jgi:hypothetical protein
VADPERRRPEDYVFSATVAAFGALTIAAVPISIGGSGLTELSMQSYLSSVYGFSSWAAVVIWRIASFQTVLAVTGIAFLILTRKTTKSKKAGLIGSQVPLEGNSALGLSAPDGGPAEPPTVEMSVKDA